MAMREEYLRAADKTTRLYRRVVGRTVHRGSTVCCPCCGSSFKRFAAQGKPDRVCWNCGSLERHRALTVYLDRESDPLRPGMRVLHVAPEAALRGRFERDDRIEYVAGDSEQRFGGQRIDVTDLAFPDTSFDIVICNHVLEHVVNDRKAMREIARVLRPHGWAILMIPSLLRDTTFEDPTVTSPAERNRVFGQSDHVRIYGWDYLDRLAEAGLVVETFRPEDHWPADDLERFRLRAPDGYDPVFVARRAATSHV